MPRATSAISPEMRTVGDMLRECREAAKLSQGDAAKKLAITQAAISQWEAGKRCPPLGALPAISAAYGLTPLTMARRLFDRIER